MVFIYSCWTHLSSTFLGYGVATATRWLAIILTYPLDGLQILDIHSNRRTMFPSKIAALWQHDIRTGTGHTFLNSTPAYSSHSVDSPRDLSRPYFLLYRHSFLLQAP